MQPNAEAIAGSMRRRHRAHAPLDAPTGAAASASAIEVEPVAHPQQPQRAEAHGGGQSGSRLKTKSRSPMVRNISAPKIAPIALPEPPNSETPPSTTAAIEYSV